MPISENSELLAQLSKYPILSHFSKADLRKLVAQSEIIEAQADEVLFSSKEPGNCLYYMIDGCMEVFGYRCYKAPIP